MRLVVTLLAILISLSAHAGGGPIMFMPATGYRLTCDSGTLDTTCTISTVKTVPDNVYIGNVVGNLVIASGGNIRNLSNKQLTTLLIGGSLTINSGGTINNNIAIRASSVTVNSGGSINADYLGYINTCNNAGQGPGGGAYGGGGGGHGGAGGNALGGQLGGTTYDSSTNPVDWGSAGGCMSAAGGYGGGIIRIVTPGNVNIAGTVSANGQSRSGYDPGGGAGGSVYISSATLTTASTTIIRADGGSGNEDGGGGGGGIVAISSDVAPKGSVSVNPGFEGGYGGYRGSYGIYSLTMSAGADGICDSGSLSSTCNISSAKVFPSNYTISGSGTLAMASSVTTNLIEIPMTTKP